VDCKRVRNYGNSVEQIFLLQYPKTKQLHTKYYVKKNNKQNQKKWLGTGRRTKIIT